jgi:hypothetical protein
MYYFERIHSFRLIYNIKGIEFVFYYPALGPTQPPLQRVQGALSVGQSGQVVEMTTHLCSVPTLKMHGATLPLPHMSSMRGV